MIARGKRFAMAKMEGLTQYSNSLALLCLIFLIANVKAQGLSAEKLLYQKEQDLNMIVQAVEDNSRNCNALMGCSGFDGGCSRLSCHKYGTQGDANYQCLDVDNNADCGSHCKERNFDFTKSYLRRVDTLDSNIARTVCTHRSLDAIFLNNNISNRTHLFRVFFGSVDGTTRIYPGLDEPCDNGYDPRLRPWFLQSTYVPKAVTVLIDSGVEMRAALAGGKDDETCIGKAKNMTLEFLKTLKDVRTYDDSEDFVNIACFDGNRYIPLKNAVPTKYNSTQLLDQSFNDTLDAIINNGSVTTNPDAVDTANAINTAISQLNSNFDSATHLKVVIVLTAGKQFKSLADLNITANSGVAVFVFNYFRFPGRVPHCSNSSSIQAYSDEILSERVDNSLYALLPYYSFLAKLHREFMDRAKILADYGKQYEDFSGVDNSTLTLSKAAFGPSGKLLGVVGLNFFQRKVEQQYNMQFQAIVIAARNHPTITYQMSNLIPNVCFNHTDECPGFDTSVRFECGVKGGDQNIGCCGKCKVKKADWPKVVGGVVGGVGGVVALVLIVVMCTRRCIARRKDHEAPSPKYVFTGPADEAVNPDNPTSSFEQRGHPS